MIVLGVCLFASTQEVKHFTVYYDFICYECNCAKCDIFV